MSKKKVSDADMARSLELLWGSRGKVGRSGLSMHSIVAAAIKIADAEGLDAVSMRQVADHLKVGTMSLYAHVPGKADLTALMVDTICGQLYEHVDAPAQQPGGWRAGVRFIAVRNWELYQQHPWLLQIVGTRPVIGPNASLKYEAELRPLDNVGLTDVEMDSVLTLILTHVEGTARSTANFQQAQRDSGMDDVEWWTAMEQMLVKMMDETRFPVGSRVGTSAGEAYQGILNPAHALNFGLERILDGVALLIAQRQPPARGAARKSNKKPSRKKFGGL